MTNASLMEMSLDNKEIINLEEKQKLVDYFNPEDFKMWGIWDRIYSAQSLRATMENEQAWNRFTGGVPNLTLQGKIQGLTNRITNLRTIVRYYDFGISLEMA